MVIRFPEESGGKKTTQQQINANVPAQCVLIGYLLLGGLPHKPMSALCLQLPCGAAAGGGARRGGGRRPAEMTYFLFN